MKMTRKYYYSSGVTTPLPYSEDWNYYHDWDNEAGGDAVNYSNFLMPSDLPFYWAAQYG